MLKTHYSTGQKRLVKVDGRVIGCLSDGTFYKSVIGSKHRLRVPQQSFAIQSDTIDELARAGVTQIIIYDRETNLRYSISLQDFLKNSFPVDRGYGPQLACPVSAFEVTGNEQLTLWGER
jgi:hypothetical protein